MPAATLNTFIALDGKAFVATANIAVRRIDAWQILQFQKRELGLCTSDNLFGVALPLAIASRLHTVPAQRRPPPATPFDLAHDYTLPILAGVAANNCAAANLRGDVQGPAARRNQARRQRLHPSAPGLTLH